jgi:DNA-binding transcriptional MerR regulator
VAGGGKSAAAFRTISEVATELALPQHVLRFWETKFTQIRPLKRAGGRRYYRPEDVALLRRVHRLLDREGYTIKGVQKLLREGAAAETAGDAATPAPAVGLGAAERLVLRSLLETLLAVRALMDTPERQP